LNPQTSAAKHAVQSGLIRSVPSARHVILRGTIMQRQALAFTIGLVALLAIGGVSAGHAADGWQAGAAKANITPEHDMWMAGYAARTRPSEGRMTDLWAKCLALEDGAGKRAVLITLDLVGIDREISTSICQKLEKQHHLDRSQIAINCSHTHSGPVVGRNLRPMHEYSLEKPQQELIHQYADKLEAAVVEVVGQAIKKLAPANLAWGNGRTDFAVNRRENKEPDVPKLREAASSKGRTITTCPCSL
jgi:hypothetical protein